MTSPTLLNPSTRPLNSTPSSPRPASKSLWTTLGRFAFDKALSAMPHGCLTVTDERGQTRLYGEAGSHPTAALTITSSDFYKRVLTYGHVGFGEAFMAGDWQSEDVFGVLMWFLANLDESTVLEGSGNTSPAFNWFGWLNRVAHSLRHNSIKNSRRNIEAHYDLSNDFFALFLDDSMTYSSARFLSPTDTLEQAQLQKYQRLCESLRLQPSDHVLEIGCGWGSMAIYMARHYGCHVTGVTISPAQFEWATAQVAAAGLSDQVQIVLKDFRYLEGTYDKIVSIEMMEALGDRYYEPFFAQCGQLLAKDGLMSIQVITCPDSRYDLIRSNVDFIQTHIFPGSLIPSLGRLMHAANRTTDFSLYEVSDMGLSYAYTLRTWLNRFNARLDEVLAMGFDPVFIRKWQYYLQYCEAAFASHTLSVVQATLTRPNNTTLVGGYRHD